MGAGRGCKGVHLQSILPAPMTALVASWRHTLVLAGNARYSTQAHIGVAFTFTVNGTLLATSDTSNVI